MIALYESRAVVTIIIVIIFLALQLAKIERGA